MPARWSIPGLWFPQCAPGQPAPARVFIPKKRLSGLIEQTGGIPTELRRMPPI